MAQKILIVVSGVDRVPLKNGKYYQTGFWLNELIQPVKRLLANGYELDFTSPGGRKPSIDPNSIKMLPDNVREDFMRVAQSLPGLWAPTPTESLGEDRLSQYSGIFVPGGHAPMVDLRDDPGLRNVFPHFNKNGKPTAAICHGPVALLSCVQAEGGWPYKGYRMTCFSKLEEYVQEEVSHVIPGPLPYYVSDELRRAGAIVKNSIFSFIPHTITDRELVTGQDPFAADKLGKEFTGMLRDYLGRQAIPVRR